MALLERGLVIVEEFHTEQIYLVQGLINSVQNDVSNYTRSDSVQLSGLVYRVAEKYEEFFPTYLCI